MIRAQRLSLVLMLLLAIAATGCKGKKQQPIDTSFNDTTTGQQSTSDGLPDIDPTKLAFTKGTGPDQLWTIYFDYDSDELRPDAIEALKHNADLLQRLSNVIAQVEGHCDERGTQDYNLALGERRALAVRRYLMNLGVSGDRLITLSYGEENPAELGSGESAWAKNRRCEFSQAVR